MKNIKRFFGLFAGIAIMACLTPSCKKGDVGPQGPQGTQGAAGEAGAQGTAGLAGNTLLNGEGAPSADLGKNGDFYLDINSLSLYGPKTTSGWGTAIPVGGAQGEAGAAGADGNANVITDTFTVSNEDWEGRGDFSHLVQSAPFSGSGFPGMYFTRYNYSINQSVLDSGVVMVSYRSAPDFDDESNRWTPMPMSFYSRSFTYNLDFTTNNHSVRLEFYLTPSFSNTNWATNEDMADVDLPKYNVKVVVISSSSIVREIAGIMKARKAGSVNAN